MDQLTLSSYEAAAERLRLLAHPARLQILDELRRGEACVCYLQRILDRPQAYVSQQLRVLREADLLDSDRDGLNVFYSIADAALLDLLAQVLGPAGPERELRICPCPSCTDEETCEPTLIP
ncbi:MAG: winged helix-turn-helix transcriptional regulator [Anaerolineae bacterium]|nr:winged helix-turn-helix transcriptional regulator [Anaerolineae bacterium]